MISTNVMTGTSFCSSFQIHELSEIGRMLSEGKLDSEIMQEVKINTKAQYLGKARTALGIDRGIKEIIVA
jgi:hypothetical protein